MYIGCSYLMDRLEYVIVNYGLIVRAEINRWFGLILAQRMCIFLYGLTFGPRYLIEQSQMARTEGEWPP